MKRPREGEAVFFLGYDITRRPFIALGRVHGRCGSEYVLHPTAAVSPGTGWKQMYLAVHRNLHELFRTRAEAERAVALHILGGRKIR